MVFKTCLLLNLKLENLFLAYLYKFSNFKLKMTKPDKKLKKIDAEYCIEEICENFNEEGFDEFKKKYTELKKKHNLPDFDKLNEDFDIVKAEVNWGTPLRDIRKVMTTKFAAIMNFVELLLNPSNGSMFHMFLVKGLNQKETEILNKIFAEIGAIEIESFALDIEYTESQEAKFIKTNYERFQPIKKELKELIDSLENNWGKTSINPKKEKSYFG